MSDDKKTASDQRKPPEIPVKAVWFSMPNGREIPIPGAHGGLVTMVNHIASGKNARGDTFAIVFEPQLRRHKVTWRSVNGQAKVFCIPESWCTYEVES